MCRQIHQETFSDPECPLSRIKAAVDQRFIIEGNGIQVSWDEMQSVTVDFREGSQFVMLRRGVIDLPKLRTWKIPVQFKTERIKTCPNYDDLRGSIDKR